MWLWIKATNCLVPFNQNHKLLRSNITADVRPARYWYAETVIWLGYCWCCGGCSWELRALGLWDCVRLKGDPAQGRKIQQLPLTAGVHCWHGAKFSGLHCAHTSTHIHTYTHTVTHYSQEYNITHKSIVTVHTYAENTYTFSFHTE